VFVGLAIIYALFVFTPVGAIVIASFESAMASLTAGIGACFGYIKGTHDPDCAGSRCLPQPEDGRGLPALIGQNSGDEVLPLSERTSTLPKQRLASSREVSKNETVRSNQESEQMHQRDPRNNLRADESLHRMGFSPKLPRLITGLVVLLVVPWIGQWLFWSGFLHLAGDT
jgi:hypothetical protein